MKRFILAVAAATALSTTAAFAAPSIADISGQGNGFATMDDIAAAFPGFDAIDFNDIDLNSDGRIDNNELLHPQSRAVLARYEPNAQSGSSRISADANGDRFVTFAELTAVIPGFTKADFHAIDVNSDNRLSVNELNTGRAGVILARSSASNDSPHLASLDANGDRFLTFREVAAGYPNLPKFEFGNIDTNDDGRLDANEFEALSAQTTLNTY